MENEEKIEATKVRALGLFAKDKFACSEAILSAVNSTMGDRLPSEVVRLASGFAGGIGGSGNVCGALTGGVMALGLAFGRTEPGGGRAKLLSATRELLDWFEQSYGSCCCAVLTDKEEASDVTETDMCAVITGRTAAKTMAIILKYDNMPPGKSIAAEAQADTEKTNSQW